VPFSQPIGAPRGSLRAVDAPAPVYDDAPPGTWWYLFKDCSPFQSIRMTLRWFGDADPSGNDTGKVSVVWYSDLSLAIVTWVDTFYLPNANRSGADTPGSREMVHLQVRGKVATIVAPTSAEPTASLTITAEGSNQILARNVFAGSDNYLNSGSNVALSDAGTTLSGGQQSQQRISGLLSGRLMLSVVAVSSADATTVFRFAPHGDDIVDLILSGTGTLTARTEILAPRCPIKASVHNRAGTTESWHYTVTREEY
jgi:hypothetical protein